MLLNAIINILGAVFVFYLVACVVIGVCYCSLYLFWSCYQIAKGDNEKVMQLDYRDIEGLFFILLRTSVIKSRKLHKRFNHFLKVRRQKKLKKAIRRLSH